MANTNKILNVVTTDSELSIDTETESLCDNCQRKTDWQDANPNNLGVFRLYDECCKNCETQARLAESWRNHLLQESDAERAERAAQAEYEFQQIKDEKLNDYIAEIDRRYPFLSDLPKCYKCDIDSDFTLTITME